MKQRVLFRCVAILLALSPLLLLEGAFRLGNIGQPDAVHDPMIGFSDQRPLFALDEQQGRFETARERRLLFGRQTFSQAKAANGYRIFTLGGSTVRGRPFETDTAFSRWMQLELSACDPNREYEVVNCGGLSYASYRLRYILEEVLQYDPDLIILATGHNEFLEDRTYAGIKQRSTVGRWIDTAATRSRVVTGLRHALRDNVRPSAGSEPGKTVLDDEVATRLDSVSGYASYHRDSEWRSAVIQHFDLSVQAMVERCRSAGVPVVLVHLGSNVRGTPPFKSEHRENLSVAQQQRWQAAFDEATSVDAEDPAAALEHYQRAAALDDQHALLSFRIARCLDRLGQHQQAKESYVRAKDQDICPLRMLSEMDSLLQQIAAGKNVPIIDAKEMIERASAHQIPGNDVYCDHVHPTIFQHQQIATAVVAQMRTSGLIPGEAIWTESERQEAYHSVFQQLGPTYLANGRERVAWLERWAQVHRLYYESVPIDATGNLHRGFRHIGFGEVESAWEDFAVALRDKPKLKSDLVDFAAELHAQGRPAASQSVLDWLDLPRSQNEQIR